MPTSRRYIWLGCFVAVPSAVFVALGEQVAWFFLALAGMLLHAGLIGEATRD